MRFLIAHSSWDPRRQESLGRLLEQLVNDEGVGPDVEVLSSLGREHAAIWARRVWEEATVWNDEQHVCILNDDVVLLPGFHERLGALVAAVPDEPISLHCTNPAVLPYAAQGEPWVRCYHYTGPAVVLPPGAARSLCRYVYGLPWAVQSRHNEDVIASMWAWDRQRPFWYALPAPVTHDTSVPSTLGYDHHPNRTPVALGGPLPDLTVRDRWRVPWVELSWLHTSWLSWHRHTIRAGMQVCAWCDGATRELRGVGKRGTMVCLACLSSAGEVAMREVNP